MLKSIKKYIFIATVCVCCCFAPGCRSFNYHDSSDEMWLQEQVEKGFLTKQEAEEILIELREEEQMMLHPHNHLLEDGELN